MSKYLRFDDITIAKDNVLLDGTLVPARKTKTILVVSVLHSFTLGVIKWHGAWRCYAFFPEEETLFNVQCMKDITAFIEQLMQERKTHE